MKALFELSAPAWCAQDRKHYLFKGLSLFAMDGTTLKIADTPELREHFGAQVYPSGRVSNYPQVRGVTLTAVPTHLIEKAAFGPYGTNEMLYAKEKMLAEIPDNSLTAFDPFVRECPSSLDGAHDDQTRRNHNWNDTSAGSLQARSHSTCA